MKKIIAGILLYTTLLAQEDINVMSYYASDNSLDGQPRIDMINVLRFFPVFAIQENITEVTPTIFYGDNIYTRIADKMNGGQYWQAMLPEFKLGDAIQRLEVKIKFSLADVRLPNINKLNNILSEIDSNNKALEFNRKNTRGLLGDIHKKIKEEVPNLNKFLVEKIVKNLMYNYPSLDTANMVKAKKAELEITSILNTTGSTMNYTDKRKSEIARQIIKLMGNKNKWEVLIEQLKLHAKYIDEYKQLKNKTENDTENLAASEAIIAQDLFNEIVGEFADSSFSGPAIRKYDLVISDDFRSATLLYRYYKNNLRYRKALDPAENLGIFRARYVPFPIVGRPSENKVDLLRPVQAGAPVVFEVGLAFGDEVVSGDNTFKPALSIARLGIAIVITEKLFRDDADILGLALTYDFNSYASIGFGRNLTQGQSYPYYSFGINRKAFEQLLTGLAGLFK